MYYIFTFRSRTGAIRFKDALLRERIGAALINTPRAAGAGCGLSVRVTDLAAARRVLSGGYESFSGIFAAKTSFGSVTYHRI